MMNFKQKSLGKRILSLFLALVMVLGMVPITAFASADGNSATQDWSLTKEGETWYLDILNGHIAADELYAALFSQNTTFGTPDPTKETSSEATVTIMGKSFSFTNKTEGGYRISGSSELSVQSDDTDKTNLGLAHGSTYTVERATTEKDVQKTYSIRIFSASYKIDEYGWEETGSFTVRHYYTPSVTVTGAEVEAENVPTKVLQGGNLVFTIPAMGDTTKTWSATVSGLSNLVSLSATEETTVTVPVASASAAQVTVEITSAVIPTYDVTLNEVDPNNVGSVAFTGTNKGLIQGGTVGLNIVCPEDTTNADYGYTVVVDGEGASYADGVVTVGSADVSVTVNFTANVLGKKDPQGTVDYNSFMSIDQIKQNIFAALVNSDASIPAGVKWDDLKYGYYPYLDIYFEGYAVAGDLSGNRTGYVSTEVALGNTHESAGLQDDEEGTYTRVYYSFGERDA